MVDFALNERIENFVIKTFAIIELDASGLEDHRYCKSLKDDVFSDESFSFSDLTSVLLFTSYDMQVVK